MTAGNTVTLYLSEEESASEFETKNRNNVSVNNFDNMGTPPAVVKSSLKLRRPSDRKFRLDLSEEELSLLDESGPKTDIYAEFMKSSARKRSSNKKKQQRISKNRVEQLRKDSSSSSDLSLPVPVPSHLDSPPVHGGNDVKDSPSGLRRRRSLYRFDSDKKRPKRRQSKETQMMIDLKKPSYEELRKNAREVSSDLFAKSGKRPRSIPKDLDILDCARKGDKANELYYMILNQYRSVGEMKRQIRNLSEENLLEDEQLGESAVKKYDVDEERDKKGCTALMIASAYNHIETLIVLFGHGAKLEARNSKGYTALAIAAYFGKMDAFNQLLDFGALTTSRTDAKHSVLVIAANQICKATNEEKYNRMLEICKIIIERTESRWVDGKDFIDEYTREDHQEKRIYDPRTRRIIKEWTKSKQFMRDLHKPSFEVYLSCEKKRSMKPIKAFFRESHEKLNVMAMLKTFVLMLFIIYDLVFNGISHNLFIYAILYVLAYFW